ncbi:MAG TPA: kelch repeat-containing protein [Bacteroidales bacterium]|nr:kelch repeat-containing protein [Bacteroidales bacterium]
MKTISLTLLLFLSIIEFNVNAQSFWVQKADLCDFTRYAAVGFAIGGTGYVCGGRSNDIVKYLNDLWAYDPISDTWSQKADFPAEARSFSVGFALMNKGYLGLGGRSLGTVLKYFDDFWEYDPITNCWTQKNNFPGGARTGAFAITSNNSGYVIAGTVEQPFSDVWQYNPISDQWVQKGDFPGVAKTTLAGFSIADSVYISSCDTWNGGNEFWLYNTSTDTWTPKTPIPLPRYGALGFSIGNYGYVGTGDQGVISKGIDELCLNDMWKYDPISDQWTELPSLNVNYGRSFAICFTIGQAAYLGTGYDSTYPSLELNDFWQLDFTVGTNEPLTSGNEPRICINTNSLDIHCSKSIKEANLLDCLGQSILRINPNSNETSLNIADLASGYYILSLLYSDKSNYSTKFFKK